MRILKSNAVALTNIDVLDFLRARGAAKDPAQVIVSIAPLKFKVFDDLEKSAACSQTTESITEFVEKCKNYNLAKAEILNTIKIIEEWDTRRRGSVKELVELVAEVLPAPPTQMKPDEAAGEDKEEIPAWQKNWTLVDATF